MKYWGFFVVMSLLSLPMNANAGFEPCSENEDWVELHLVCNGIPYLHPKNQSDWNFWLLLSAYHAIEPIPEDSNFSDLCDNSAQNTESFLHAIQSIQPPQTAALMEIRQEIHRLCQEDPERDWRQWKDEFLPQQKEKIHQLFNQLEANPVTEPYRVFLQGIMAFYEEDFLKAATFFQALNNGKPDWIHETASYLEGRSFALAAQKDWDGWFDSVDEHLPNLPFLEKAEQAWKHYLQYYPQGLYVSTIQNFFRRISFLKRDQKALDRQLIQLFQQITVYPQQTWPYLPLLEISNHYRGKVIEPWQPLLTAYAFFQGYQPSPEDWENLSRAQIAYTKYPGLYEWLHEYERFRQGNYQAVLQNFSSETPLSDDLILFSRWVLQAEAAQALQLFPKAQAIWHKLALVKPHFFPIAREGWPMLLELRPEAHEHFLQVSLARHYLLAGQLEKIFAQGSGVQSLPVAKIILEHLASNQMLENLLQAQTTQPAFLPFVKQTLLKTYLFQERYHDFVRIEAMPGDSASFSQVLVSAQKLAQNLNDPEGLLGVGAFLQTEDIFAPVACEQAGFTREFCKQYPSRYGQKEIAAPFRYYQKGLQVIQQQGHGKTHPAEAELLARAIQCFRNGGYFYCTWNRDYRKENQGRLWFQRLKKVYPKSPWSQNTKYWF